jgi:hypothetical protein
MFFTERCRATLLWTFNTLKINSISRMARLLQKDPRTFLAETFVQQKYGSWFLPSVIAGTLACGLAGGAVASPITCDVSDATANGAIADECAGDTGVGANTSDEAAFVNSEFGGSPFTFVDKTGEASSVAGFVLSVETGGDSDPFKFLYKLTVPDSYVGTVIDWVLVIKQGSNSTLAYLFESVTLGIDGGFNNFWLNPSGKAVNDFSHASGLIRTTTVPVPEPATLTLVVLGLMLTGVSGLRRRL